MCYPGWILLQTIRSETVANLYILFMLYLNNKKANFYIQNLKGPVLKSFMRQVAIIEAHGVPWKFWIL